MKSPCLTILVALPLLLGQQNQTPSSPVRVAPVVEQKVASTVDLVGTVIPKRRSIVASGADGLVIALGEVQEIDGKRAVVREIDVGMEVKKDEVVAQLRTRTLRITEEAAQAALQQSEFELAELKKRLPSDEERARAAMAAGMAKEKMAQSKHKRLERLMARNAASGEDLDESLGLAVMAAEDVARLRAEFDLARVESGPGAERLKQAEAKVETARGELLRVQDEIEKRTVRAPFDGFVVAKYTEVGQWLSQSSPVFEIVELNQVEVEVMVPERHMREIRAGAKVDVRIDALAESQPRKGTIARVIAQADTKSRLFPIRVLLPNEKDETGERPIRGGMFAVAHLPLGTKHVARLVPKDALVLQAGKSVVYAVETSSNGGSAKVTSVSVKPGSAHEDMVEVEGNLKPGQLVVIRGNERLANGQTVQIENQSTKANGSTTEP